MIGGKDGYVGRDGQLVDMADLSKRQSLSSEGRPRPDSTN